MRYCAGERSKKLSKIDPRRRRDIEGQIEARSGSMLFNVGTADKKREADEFVEVPLAAETSTTWRLSRARFSRLPTGQYAN